LTPYLLRQATDALTLAGTPGYSGLAVLLAGAYGACWTAARACEWLKTMVSAAILTRCDAAFHGAFYDRIVHADFRRLLSLDVGAMAAVVKRSRAAFSSITYTLFWVVGPTVFQLIASCIVIAKTTSMVLSLAFAVSMLGLFVVTWLLAARSKNAHALIFGADNALSSHLVEKLAFTLDIKLNAAYRRESVALGRILEDYIDDVSRGNARLAFILAGQACATGLVLTLFTVATAVGVTHHAFKVGDFILIVGYVVQLTMPFSVLSATLSDLRRSHLALREGADILALPQETGRDDGPIDIAQASVYEIDAARLMIEGWLRLDIAEFRVAYGELVVVIGPSGSGKSSLLYILLGLLRPQGANMRFFGVDLATVATVAIARSVAAVSQYPLIVSGTLRDNLNYGCDTPNDDAFLLEILRDLELLELRPGTQCDLLELELGVQGRELSGGERQRIALARALVRKTPVLILDEPTSSLDPQREERIMARIRQRVPTIIAVTHRQGLCRLADRVYEVREGAVVPMPGGHPH
jgi:ATP-binding cassette subfamily B protein